MTTESSTKYDPVQQSKQIKSRTPDRIATAIPSHDGVGVKINRIAGRDMFRDLDPFLLIDEIRSDDASDYIGGFPDHPHRGFETITYLRHGKMRHGDHLGNSGLLNSGDLQWMTAGRGVIHSEMPEQDEGLLHGFQIWLNLPAREKLVAADYRDYRASQFPIVRLTDNSFIRVLAGSLTLQDQEICSPLQSPHLPINYFEVVLGAREQWQHSFPAQQSLLVYVFDGSSQFMQSQQLGIYRPQQQNTLQPLELTAGAEGMKAIVLSGPPLREPIAQYGPFVMNTTDEIEQAIEDYQQGRLTS